MSFEGKIAVVTGAGSGIGAGISEGIAKRGGKVYVTDLRLDAATQVAEDLKAKGYLAEAMHLDVTDEKEIHTVVEEIIAAEGYIDFWINNSGISIITPFFKHTDEIWDKTLNINLTSQFKCCREVIPHMTPERGGSIINMSSQSGKAGTDAYQAYCASKSGVIGLTQSLAREFGPQGIRINALCPGIIVTPMWDQQVEWRRKPPPPSGQYWPPPAGQRHFGEGESSPPRPHHCPLPEFPPGLLPTGKFPLSETFPWHGRSQSHGQCPHNRSR